VSKKELTQVVVEEEALWIKRCTNTSEIVEAGVQGGQTRSVLRMHLSPVGPPLVTSENGFNTVKIGPICHAFVHMDSDISRRTLIGRTQPDIVGLDKATLYRKVNLK
jgi:hypothetical protein